MNSPAIMPSPRTVILKVGGSLFDLRDLGPRIERILAVVHADLKIVYPGGGEAADLVRIWHERYGLTESQSHWIAIHALETNANLLRAIIPNSTMLSHQQALRIYPDQSKPFILAPFYFTRVTTRRISFDDAPPHIGSHDGWSVPEADDAPPHLWDVTSDTLAAWTAIRWPADELVMIKSVPCPIGRTATEAVQMGLVDPYFPGYAGRIPRVSWCCLRDDEPQITPWLENGASVTKDAQG